MSDDQRQALAEAQRLLRDRGVARVDLRQHHLEVKLHMLDGSTFEASSLQSALVELPDPCPYCDGMRAFYVRIDAPVRDAVVGCKACDARLSLSEDSSYRRILWGDGVLLRRRAGRQEREDELHAESCTDPNCTRCGGAALELP